MAGYVTSTQEIAEAYRKIQIYARDGKVALAPSDDGKTKLLLLEKKKHPYTVSVREGLLTLKPSRTKWYHFLRLGIDRSEIRLLVPQSTLEEIKVKANVGKVDLHSIACSGPIEIQTNTGTLHAEDVTCQNFNTKGNTGSAILNRLQAKESITVKRNTGNVTLNDCAAPKIFVKTNTGKACGRLPSDTMFLTRTNPGRVKTPQAPIGAQIGCICEIKTNTGNIKFE